MDGNGMTALVPKKAKPGQMVKAYGWIMNWKPLRSVQKKKIGEEWTIKTIFKRKIGEEMVSIYIGNVLVRDPLLIEKRKEYPEIPIPLFIRGRRGGEKAYNNFLLESPEGRQIEGTKYVLYVFLKMGGLEVKIGEEIPGELLERAGVTPPPMTLKKYYQSKNARERRASRR